MSEKAFDLWNAHLQGVAYVVEQDETLDPGGVSFFGADGVVLAPYGVTDAVEQFLFVVFPHAIVFAWMGFLVYTSQAWRCSIALAWISVTSTRIRVWAGFRHSVPN